METYSSRIRSATAWASVRTRRASLESWSCVSPDTFGSLASSCRRPSATVAGLHADAVEHRRHDAVGLLGEDEEQVGDLELGVAFRLGELLRADDRLGGASG